MSGAKLIDRLDRPKQTRPGAWLAGCPCCQSKRGRPISVRELDDGRVLLYAFCGCGTDAVLAALGLTLSDLFPERLPLHSYAASHSHIQARDLLEIISEEASVVAIIAADLLARKTISEKDWQRLATAVARMGRARDHAYGG
jgi:hypothetical protein